MQWPCALLLVTGCRDLLGIDDPRVIDGRSVDTVDGAAMGLGKRCSTSATCDMAAPACLSYGGMFGFCTALCVDNGSAMTDATGSLGPITPPPNQATCTSAFVATTGTATCGVVIATTPPDLPLKPNAAYTNIMAACFVACAPDHGCPPGLTCDTTSAICLP